MGDIRNPTQQERSRKASFLRCEDPPQLLPQTGARHTMVIICITESRDEKIIHLPSTSKDDALKQVRYLKQCNPTKQFILKASE